MIVITGTVRIPPGAVDRVRPAMERMLMASRAEDGCQHYAYAIDVLDETIVHISEIWRDREALQGHFSTTHMAEWRAQFSELGITDRNLTLFETDAGTPV